MVSAVTKRTVISTVRYIVRYHRGENVIDNRYRRYRYNIGTYIFIVNTDGGAITNQYFYPSLKLKKKED